MKFFSLKKNDQSGQATIEFILSFSFMLFFVLFFVTIGLNLSLGYVTHFSVYKASRHFLTFDNGSPNNATNLLQAISSSEILFRKINNEIKLEGEFKIHSPDDPAMQIYEYVGAKFLYKPRINAMGPFALPEDYKWLSESFLGKEPTRADCRCQTQRALGEACEDEIPTDIEITVYDNGC